MKVVSGFTISQCYHMCYAAVSSHSRPMAWQQCPNRSQGYNTSNHSRPRLWGLQTTAVFGLGSLGSWSSSGGWSGASDAGSTRPRGRAVAENRQLTSTTHGVCTGIPATRYGRRSWLFHPTWQPWPSEGNRYSPGFFFGRLGGNVGEWNFRKIEFWQNSWVLGLSFRKIPLS